MNPLTKQKISPRVKYRSTGKTRRDRIRIEDNEIEQVFTQLHLEEYNSLLELSEHTFNNSERQHELFKYRQ